MEIGDRIKTLRNAKKLSQAQLADQIGMKNYNVADWEQGRSEPSVDLLGKIASALGVPVASLLDGGNATPVDLPVTPRSVPVWGSIRAGNGENGIEGEVIGEIEVTEADFMAGIFAVRVSGDSMSPRILDGDYVLFEPPKNDCPKDGTVCAILVEGWTEGIIKALYRETPDRSSLRSLNPDFKPIEIDTTTTKVEIKGRPDEVGRPFPWSQEAGRTVQGEEEVREGRR